MVPSPTEPALTTCIMATAGGNGFKEPLQNSGDARYNSPTPTDLARKAIPERSTRCVSV